MPDILEQTPDILDLTFEFFILFSKFECALKHSGYLKRSRGYAEPDWNKFADNSEASLEKLFSYSNQRTVSHALYITTAPPKRQWVENGRLTWKETESPRNFKDFLNCIKTVRNNLFHGGKFGCDGFTDPERSFQLIAASIAILAELKQYIPTEFN